VKEWLIVLLFVCVVPWLGGCWLCLDVEENIRVGNIVTYERGRVCVDSTHRGLSSSAKLCFRRVCER
jgi:hypothetical protein